MGTLKAIRALQLTPIGGSRPLASSPLFSRIAQPAVAESSSTAQSATSQPSNAARDCNICLSQMETSETLRALPCAHAFHAACINRWLSRAHTCPTCRATVPTA